MKLKYVIRTLIVMAAVTVCQVPFTARAEDSGHLTAEMVQIMELSENAMTVTGIVKTSLLLSEELIVEESLRPKRSYSEDDLYILAHVICGEAQSYSDEEQRYVGSVVLNRVSSSRYPNTISGVVFQKGQYSCTRDGNYYRTPTERNWANARYLLENGSILPENVVYQSGGRQGKGVYLKTSKHYYCYY